MYLLNTEEYFDVMDALTLPLLFHSGGKPNVVLWREITGTDEMTTKVMCTHIRRVLEENGMPIPQDILDD